MRFLSFTLVLYIATCFASPPAQDQSPRSGAQVISEARRLANTGRGEEALRLLDSQAPASSKVQTARGLAYYDLDRLPDADKAFAMALRANPQDTEASQMRGLTLFRLGRPAEAIPLLEAAKAADVQTKSSPWYVLALCYVDTRRYDDARHAYAAQYGLSPDSASAYLLAARMLLRREYLPVAQRFAEEAVKLESHLPMAHELLGEIALAQNHVDIAIAEFQQERETNPLEPSTYERLGDAYTRQGNYPEARRLLQQAVLLEPNSTGPYILLGKVALKEDDAVAALTFLQRAERMDPANYMTHNLLAQTFRTLGRSADAARELKLVQETQADTTPKLAPVK